MLAARCDPHSITFFNQVSPVHLQPRVQQLTLVFAEPLKEDLLDSTHLLVTI